MSILVQDTGYSIQNKVMFFKQRIQDLDLPYIFYNKIGYAQICMTRAWGPSAAARIDLALARALGLRYARGPNLARRKVFYG